MLVLRNMSAKRSPKSVSRAPEELIQVAIRLERSVVERLDLLAAKLSQPGLSITRTDALRVALHKGLEAFAKEQGPS